MPSGSGMRFHASLFEIRTFSGGTSFFFKYS
eukprot:COSAG02_NODE_70538_length_195_cov_37.250000_1_plen_30_part_10